MHIEDLVDLLGMVEKELPGSNTFIHKEGKDLYVTTKLQHEGKSYGHGSTLPSLILSSKPLVKSSFVYHINSIKEGLRNV